MFRFQASASKRSSHQQFDLSLVWAANALKERLAMKVVAFSFAGLPGIHQPGSSFSISYLSRGDYEFVRPTITGVDLAE